MKSRFLIILTILALSLSACVSLAEDITPPPDANHPAPAETEEPAEEDVSATEEPAEEAPAEDIDGAALFAENCALCHAKDGTGATTTVDLSDGERMGNFPDQMLAALIEKGNETMPAFGQFSDAELNALVAYIRVLGGNTPEAEATDDGEEQAENTSEGVLLTGNIGGTVTNGTTGGDLPDNLTIQLEIYEHDMMSGGFSKVDILETPINEDGSYLFEEIDLIEGRAFLAIIDNDGVIYSSQPNFVSEGTTELKLPLTYYEKSTDTATLTIDRLHIFFEPPNIEAELAHIVEVFVVSNPSLYAIVPEDGKAVVEFLLPEGAINVEFEDSVFGERYTETVAGFGDTEPILPGIGTHEIVVFFEMPYEKKFLSGNSLNFVQKIDYPIDSAIVMAPQGMKIKSDLLTESGEREAQGLVFNTYSSQPLPIGATFEMGVSGSVSINAVGNETDPQQNIIYGALALGLVLIGAGLWFYMRDRDEEDDEDFDDEDENDSAEIDDTDELMDAIIALDDAHRSGDISEEAYKKRRAALKKQLQELV